MIQKLSDGIFVVNGDTWGVGKRYHLTETIGSGTFGMYPFLSFPLFLFYDAHKLFDKSETNAEDQ